MKREKILKALEEELAFLEERGYERRPGGNWGPPLLFEDSPVCARQPVGHAGCENCPLYGFVPRSARHTKVPCRHIVLDGKAMTLDRMYREATQREAVAAVRGWLQTTIAGFNG